MLNFLKTTFLAAALMQSLPAGATENSWESMGVTMTYSGLGFSKSRRGTIDSGETIYTSGTEAPGLMLSCVAGRLFAAISIEPQDFRETFTKTGRHHKTRHVDVKLNDGARKGLGLWIYKPSLHAVSSRKRSQAAKLYNMVVRGDRVEILMDQKGTIVLDLPKPNAAFADFGARCGLGRNANKD